MGEKKKVYTRESCSGALWFAGWMFSIGFLKLTFWKAVLAVIIWPYYLGAMLSAAP